MQKTTLIWVLISFGFLFNSAFAEPEDTSANDSANETSESDRASYLDPELKKQRALADTLKEHEIVWLDVSYPEASQTQKTLAIKQPSLIAEEQGAIVLIHDKEQHADWPQIIRPLRQTLPENGWFTLSVSLPDDTRIKLPERRLPAKSFDQLMLSDALRASLDSGRRSRDEGTPKQNVASGDTPENSLPEGENSDDDPGSDSPVDIDLADAKQQDQNKLPYDTRALAHIEKAVEHLRSENYQNIVMIAHRHSAELALDYIKANQGTLVSPGFTFILIEPLINEAYLLNLNEWLGDSFSLPILDVVNRSSAQANEDAKRRQLALQKAGVKNHRQIFLTISNSEVFNESLSRRVRLWLEANAPGMKINQ